MTTSKEILKKHFSQSELSFTNNAIHGRASTVLKAMEEYHEAKVKEMGLFSVSQQRELLLNFMTYVSPEAYATHSKAELADNYLSRNCD